MLRVSNKCNKSCNNEYKKSISLNIGNIGVSCAETIAVQYGLLFAPAGTTDCLIVERDCKMVMDKLQYHKVEDGSYLSGIVEDYRHVTE